MAPESAARPVDTLIHARHVVPVVPRHTVLSDHAVVLNHGVIVDLLPGDTARQRYTPRREYRLDEHVLMPGLINAHGHAAMSLFRGLADDHPLMTWLQEHIWPAESRWVHEDFVRDGTRLAVAEMIRHGTTCFSDMYFFPDATAAIAEHAGMRAQLMFPILDFATAWAESADEYLDKGLAVRDRLKGSPLLTVGFGPHAPYTVSDGPLRKVAILAAELDAPIQIHVHETAGEVADALREDGRRPLQRLADLNLLGPRTQCVHLTQVDDNDIRLLADHGVQAVHCPESNLKLASGFCPVTRLLDAGINVALGTDSAASNNDLDLLGEARTAALLAKAVAGDASALPAFQALEMATLNGARALGQEAHLGSLETGKAADLCALRLDTLQTQPLYHAVSQLIYTQCSQQVTHVWVAGKPLLEEQHLTTLALPDILRSARTWQSRIASHA